MAHINQSYSSFLGQNYSFLSVLEDQIGRLEEEKESFICLNPITQEIQSPLHEETISIEVVQREPRETCSLNSTFSNVCSVTASELPHHEVYKVYPDNAPTVTVEIPSVTTGKRACLNKRSKHQAVLKKQYLCDKCGIQIEGSDQFSRHNSIKHDGRVFTCSLCPVTCTRRSILMRHMRKMHK